MRRAFPSPHRRLDEVLTQSWLADETRLSAGIWMSKGQDMPVLVMDVEGTDGRERGEDQVRSRSLAVSPPLVPA